MADKNKILSTIGLCKRAGKLITGFDAVTADLDKAAGVIITSDLSEKTKKEIAYHCGKHNTKLTEINNTLDITMTDIEGILGRKTGIMAITDGGLFSIFENI